MLKKVVVFLGLLIGVAVICLVIRVTPSYEYRKAELPNTFDAYYAQQLKIEQQLKVRPGNGVKLIRKSNGKTKVALLYIHGFTASRGEGEYIVDRLADSLNANTYYLRLPGHGTNADDHARVSFKDYLDEAQTALRMVQMLGDEVIVIGNSMGGLVATYLAASNPELVDQLILSSPFYDYANKMGGLVGIPGMLGLIELVDGAYRSAKGSARWKARVQPGYENFWYTKPKYSSLKSLDDLKTYVARKEIFEKVNCPVLMFYYYENEENQDKASSVPAMLKAFKLFESKEKEKLAIADGSHVLTSAYIKTDKSTILKAMIEFTRNR